ncbi:hypothetical protein CRV00_06275 [Malaciobacter molluscorum]|uniref:hypothetical protein n=1 Tax=Malaciobacter molluscorum TaxID=1032072 RepID=UPI00100B787A|nr:hypothetical protein [Malaciobacter molluscorum]RXJ94530.1 hypothetical protein CRV00_06275 [Malaciobacter molluscorum]
MYDEKKEQLREVLNKNMSKESIQLKLNEEKQKQELIKQSKKNKQKKLFYILITLFTLIVISFITYIFVSTNLKKQQIDKKEKIDIKITPKIKDIVEKKISDKNSLKREEDNLTSKKDLKTLFNAKKFDLIKCYDYDTFQKKPTINCNKKIKEFIENNINSSVRFEVIGIVGEKDINKAKEYSKKEQIQKYIINGISRDRVVEAFWVIKEIIGDKNIILTPVNYNIISKESNKGIIIRAYKN